MAGEESGARNCYRSMSVVKKSNAVMWALSSVSELLEGRVTGDMRPVPPLSKG